MYIDMSNNIYGKLSEIANNCKTIFSCRMEAMLLPIQIIECFIEIIIYTKYECECHQTNS